MSEFRTRTQFDNLPPAPYKMVGRRCSPVGSCTSSPGPPVIPFVDNRSGNYSPKLESTVMTDVLIPNFYKRRALGEIFCNPMSKVYTISQDEVTHISMGFNVQALGCSPQRYIDYDRVSASGTLPVSLLVPLPSKVLVDTANLEDQAVSKAWANTANAEILLLGMIAEINDTIKLAVDILHGVYKIHRIVRHGEFRYLKKMLSLKNLTDIYMTARYGLRPLYYDAIGVLAIFNDIAKHVDRQTYRAKTSGNDSSKTSDTSSYFINATNRFDLIWQKLSKREISYRAGVLCQLDPTSLMNQCGVGLIAETLWDLTPYSFIIDWFVNVGDTILAWTPKPGVKPLASWVVKEDSSLVASTIIGMNWSYDGPYSKYTYSDHYASATPAVCSKLEISKTRIPHPHRAVIPTWNLNLDPLKFLDLGIILKQLASR